jgi:hypothetical protein
MKYGVALAVALSALVANRPAQAGDVYGVTLLDNQLISIDTTTGAGTLIGPLSTTMTPFGLANVGGNLYTFDSNDSVISQLDPTSGLTISTFNIGIGPVLGQGGMAFENSSVGFLTSALDPTTFNPVNDLYEFNIATGTSTLIGHTADTIEALAFSSTGVLYALGKLDGNLYTIDTTTGAMTLVGNVGVSIGSPTGGLTFGADGTLYATLDDKLYTLSTTDGLATAVGSSDPSMYTGFSSISGLAFDFQSVPEPSSVVSLGIGLTLVIGICRRVRRQKV